MKNVVRLSGIIMGTLILFMVASCEGKDTGARDECEKGLTDCRNACEDAFKAAQANYESCMVACANQLTAAIDACENDPNPVTRKACVDAALAAFETCTQKCQGDINKALQDLDACRNACLPAYQECIAKL